MLSSIGKNCLEKLPTELKLMIMKNLPQKDLSSVALVSKDLRDVAFDPRLWTQITINRHVVEKIEKEGASSFLRYCKKFTKIKVLKIKCLTSQIPTKFLSNLIAKVEKLDLSGEMLTKKQVIFLIKLTLKSNSLLSLDLSGNTLFFVPKVLLCSAIIKLRDVFLYYTRLSTEQVVAVLETVIKSNSLISLNLGNNSLKYVPELLLSKAIIKLNNLDLSGILSRLSMEQIVAILEAVLKSNSLISLNLGECNLEDVPKELLSLAKMKLQNLTLSDIKDEDLGDGNHMIANRDYLAAIVDKMNDQWQ